MKPAWQNLLLSSTKRMFSPRKIVLFNALFAVCLVSSVVTALAAFREQPYRSFIQTNATARFATNAFGQGGFAFIAGGVVLDGQAEFYLDENKQMVSAADLALQVDERQKVYLTYRGVPYQLEAHAGVACPLGKFIIRNGLVLYTVPPDVPKGLEDEQARRITKEGLVRVRMSGGFVAKEFENTNFVELLSGSDFAATVSLPKNINEELVQSINDALGKGRRLAEDLGPMGSYVNTDSQIVYKTYLLAGTKRVDIAGVPLRYDWDYATDGLALVNSVRAYSTKWRGAPELANLADKNARVSQYDYVTFYQIGGIFRQIFMSNPSSFRSFVDKACAN